MSGKVGGRCSQNDRVAISWNGNNQERSRFVGLVWARAVLDVLGLGCTKFGVYTNILARV